MSAPMLAPEKKSSWVTTLIGILSMVLAGFTVYQHPEKITDPQTIGLFAAGGGLVAAKDSNAK